MYGKSWPKFEQVSKKVPTSLTLEPLAFNEYFRFDTSAFFMRTKFSILEYRSRSKGFIRIKNAEYQNGNIHRKLMVAISTILRHP